MNDRQLSEAILRRLLEYPYSTNRALEKALHIDAETAARHLGALEAAGRIRRKEQYCSLSDKFEAMCTSLEKIKASQARKPAGPAKTAKQRGQHGSPQPPRKVKTNWKALRRERRSCKTSGYTGPVPEGWKPSSGPSGGSRPPSGKPLPGVKELNLPKHNWLVDD